MVTAPVCIVRHRPGFVPWLPWVVIDLRPWAQAPVACCTTWQEAMDIATYRATSPRPGGQP